MKIDELKLEFIKKSNRFNGFINSLKNLIKAKENHIDTINKEGLSVIEFSLDRDHINPLKDEINELREIINDLEKLHLLYEDWKIRVGKK